MKKILAFLLACLLLLTCVACNPANNDPTPNDTSTSGDGNDESGNPDDSDETTDEVTTEIITDEWGRPLVEYDLPIDSLDFGKEFWIAAWDNDYAKVDLGDYEKPADALELVLVERNMQIEEELGIEFKYDRYAASSADSALNKQIEQDWKAGGTYSMIHNYAAYSVAPMIRNYLVDLKDSEAMPYLDLTKPWWNDKFIENTQGMGHLYYIIGDSNLCAYNRMMATYVNFDLYEKYVTGDDYIDLYDLVLEGDWTYDVLFTYASIWDDKNGSDSKDANDVYGLLSNANCEAYDGFLYAFNLELTVENDDGTHAWNVDGNALLEDGMSKVVNLYNQNGVWLIAKTPGAETTSTQQYQMFANSNAIFDIDVIYRYAEQNKAFREMKDKYGLLPLPKYDTNQKQYGSGMQDSYAIVSVPSNARLDAEMASAVLEHMNALSYEYVRPYYFEKIMKAKYLGTSEASRVFDIILDNSDFDFGEQFNVALEGAKYKLWRSVAKNEGTVDGAWETNSDKLTTALRELDEWFQVRDMFDE